MCILWQASKGHFIAGNIFELPEQSLVIIYSNDQKCFIVYKIFFFINKFKLKIMFRTFLVTGQIWKIVSHIIGFDFWKMVKTIFEEVFVHDSFKSLYINWLLYSKYEWCQKETLVKFLFSVMQLKLRSRTWCNGQHFSIVNVFLQYAFLKDKKMKNTIAESSFIFL
jgi:hypothetical protein